MKVGELQGEVIAWGVFEGRRIPLLSAESGAVHSQYDWDDWKDYILRERYRSLGMPLYLKLPFHYHALPASLRNTALRILRRRTSTSVPGRSFPGFPIEQGFELLCFIHEHRGTARASKSMSQIILTHDVDTKSGLKWVEEIARLEMEYGFRSLWNVVGHRYKIDYSILDRLEANGFEIGLHGYNHDNRDAFLPESELRYRLNKCGDFLRRYRVKSFRSPSWFRSETLFSVLKDYFQYDYSYLDTDVLCPGGNGGCLWTKTFSLFAGLTHIPTTLPFEAPLFFGCATEQLVEFWKPKVAWLKSCGGNIVINTHPEPHYSGNIRMLKAYGELLALLKD